MKNEKRMAAGSIVAIIILIFTLVVGIAVYAMLPKVVNIYVEGANIAVRQAIIDKIMPVLYTAGIPVLSMLTLSLLMMFNIAKGKAFKKINVLYLRLISLFSIILALVFIYPIFTMDSIYPIVIFVIFVVLSVITLVFADLFATAIRIKEENELTI